jgi:hypothetical protein
LLASREKEKEKEREMSNAKTARFGPAANWEGYRRQPNYTEAMKEGMDCRPVSGHYTDGDGRSWSWHQTYAPWINRYRPIVECISINKI